MEQLNWSKPPRLKSVRTKGHPNGCLTAIQLVFNDNSESPLFDTHKIAADNEGIKEVKLRGRSITQVTSKWKNTYITSLSLTHEAGTQVVYDKNYSESNMQNGSQTIKEDHCIVGIYGSLYPSGWLSQLGFIVTEKN